MRIEKKLYSPRQVAERYGVKISTVWAWIREAKLPAVKLGRLYRVFENDLAAFELKKQNQGRRNKR